MAILNRLHIRIMLPFIGLFAVISLVSVVLDHHYIGKLMDERIARQTDRISAVLSNSAFVLNPVYLSKLRDVIESDILILNPAGDVIVSTLPPDNAASLAGKLNIFPLFAQLETTGREVERRTVAFGGEDCLLTARLLPNSGNPTDSRILLTLSSLSDVSAATAAIGYQRIIVSVLSLILTAFFGYFIARSVSKPVNDLVSVTGQIAEGRFDGRAALPRIEEIGKLAAAINTMSEKLSNFEQQVAHSSRLAAAGRVTTALAHEIRNPLSSIKMMTQLLRNRLTETPGSEKIIHSLLEEISRLERIVSDAINLTRPTELRLTAQPIHEALNEVLPVIDPKLSHRKIHLTTDFEDNLPDVLMDRDKIKQVLWNLLLNAMESMPDGGEITLRTRHNHGEGALEITIEDEGCGIDTEKMETVFTHFYSTKPEGLGLGLATSREIILGHNGKLTIDNRSEKGVIAVISLPAIHQPLLQKHTRIIG